MKAPLLRNGVELECATHELGPEELSRMMEGRDAHSSLQLEHLGGPEGLARLLSVNLVTGLFPSADFERRRDVYGRNYVPSVRPLSYWSFFLDNLNDLTIIMLCIASAVSLALGLSLGEDKSTGWIEGTAILVSVLVVVNVQATNDFLKDRQFQKLNKQVENIPISLIRGGQPVTVPTFDVLVGDILILQVRVSSFDIECRNSELGWR